MAPAIISAEICPCGTEKEYGGPNKNILACEHCDRGCLIQRDTKEECPRCEAFNKHWTHLIEEIYGPGRAA